MYRKKIHLHFVGIGGVGMSGIAKILKLQGYIISGCDADMDQQSIQDLRTLGCHIYHGNNIPECHNPSIDILVYSSAIKLHNPEIVAAQQRGIPTISRALMLAELMRTKYSIAIAGAHGKTTTTSLIAHILLEAKKDPTVIIGGHLKNISSNAHFGLGDFLVAETDESDKSLAHLSATLAIITNIDLEHLDVYQNIDDIKQVFKQFLYNIPFYGKAIICIDDPQVRSLLPMSHIKFIKYGLESSLADIYAQDISLQPDYSTFLVSTKYTTLGTIRLNMPGKHNILNCLAAIALALEVDIPFDVIQHALSNFKGIERRFSYKGTYQGAEIFDDYGHHPEEIRNTLLVARQRSRNKLTVIFQPHRFTRTEKLWDVFVEMFINSSLDHLIVTDIYPASESPISGITGEKLAQAIARYKPPFTVHYIPYDEKFSMIKEQLSQLISSDDLLLLQGAGKINKLAHLLINS